MSVLISQANPEQLKLFIEALQDTKLELPRKSPPKFGQKTANRPIDATKKRIVSQMTTALQKLNTTHVQIYGNKVRKLEG